MTGDRDACTYAELRSRVLSRALRWDSLALRPGDRVAYLGRNTPSFLEAYFAAAWLGLVLVPLNHRLHPRELASILADCKPRLFLAEGTFAALQAAVGYRECPSLAAEPPAPVSPAELSDPQGPALVARKPDDLAHLYYTSGTTGRPKGVMLTHGNVAAHALITITELELNADDRWGHFAPLFHLADAWAAFAITHVGGTHILPGAFDAEEALGHIERQRVTLTNLVPTMLALMIANPRAASFDPRSLRMILSGGAPIAPALVRRVLDTFRCRYVQTYGMTESSPFLTLGLLSEELEALPEPERLALVARTGRAFRAVELQIVAADGSQVPSDDRTVGEIRAKGPTISPGYWRNPDATAAAFREGWLYTGDLAVIDEHGYLNIVDRKQDVIITGGENVYSTEVEGVLFEHPGVLEAAVIGRADERFGERVHAIVALRPGARVGAGELIAFVRERIAAFKAPRSIEFRDELPKTGSGKIAKHRLRDSEARA